MLEYICHQCGTGHTVQEWRVRDLDNQVCNCCPTCGICPPRSSLFTLATRRNASQAIAHDVDCATTYLVACVERDAQRATDEYRAWATERTQRLMAHLTLLDYCHNDLQSTCRVRLLTSWITP